MCLVTVASLRQNLLHPACLFVYVSLLGFGLNIPLFCINYFPGAQYEDSVMAGVSCIVLTSTAATIAGSLLLPRFSIAPGFLRLNTTHPESSYLGYILCLAWLTLCGLIRMKFHLGEPGVQPNLPFAGVLQFAFYEGAIIVALWYLSRSLQSSIIHILLGLSLLAGIALIQSLLGWRGGIFAMLMAGVGIFILQDASVKTRSPVWLAALAVRASKLGGEAEYAKTEEGFLTRVLYRGQGTSRLAEIVKFYGEVTATNNSTYKELAEKNTSAREYIDRELYGIDKSQSHSIGTSGPGGPYVNFGLVGVFLSYLFLGLVFKFIYNLIWLSNVNNPIAKIIYSYLILTAVQTQSENYGLLQIKGIFAITTLGFAFNYLINSISREPSNRKADQNRGEIATDTKQVRASMFNT
jgi:hypothetical protein